MGGKWEAVLEMTRNFLNSSHISDFVNILSNECFLPFIHYQTQTTFLLVLLKQSGKKEVSGHARQESLFFSSYKKEMLRNIFLVLAPLSPRQYQYLLNNTKPFTSTRTLG